MTKNGAPGPQAPGHAPARRRNRRRCPRLLGRCARLWPKTREQRDWFHKLGNILDKLPKRLQPRLKAALHEVMYAETREQAREAITRFATEYDPKYPKAVTTLEKDADVLLTFFDFPAEHWKHLRTFECDRLILRDRAAASTGYEGRRLTDEGAPDGLQAPRHGADPVEAARRCTPPATGACRHRLRGWRSARGEGWQAEGEGGMIPPRSSASVCALKAIHHMTPGCPEKWQDPPC